MAFFKDLVNRLTKKQEPAEQKEPVKQEPEKPVISGSTVGKIVKVNAADTTSGADILRELDAISQKLAAMTFSSCSARICSSLPAGNTSATTSSTSTCAWMAWAVRALSPVSITVRTPSALSCSIA